MQWYPIQGYEGRYEVSEDGQKVRSVPRKIRFVDAERILPSKILKPNKVGAYHFHTGNNVKYVRREQIVPVYPKKTPKTE